MGRVRAVAFDYYFTLADPGRSSRDTLKVMLTDLAASFDVDDLLQARALLKMGDIGRAVDGEPPPFRSFRDGWTTYGDQLLSSLGISGAGSSFADARAAAHASAVVFDDAQDTLDRLRAAGYRLAVLSDADTGYLQSNISRNGLTLDAVLSSEQLRCYKPHSSVFRAICEALDLEPGNVAYVGDNPTIDVDGARQAGAE